MYFGLPDDALALREGLREVLATACTPATIRAAWDGDPCDALWKTLGEFGVLGLLVPEDRGGLGLDALAFVGAMEECGYAGVPGPLVETVAFLPLTELPVDGSARVAAGGSDLVVHAGWATHLATDVVAEMPDHELVSSLDASRRVGRMTAGPAPDGTLATLGTAAFLLGLARRQLDLTVGYVKERKQFGVPIGTFQALKHPLADAAVGTEFAWPAVLRAAQALSDHDDLHHVSMAKALASDASYRMSRVCLQAHGAMGYTVEYDLHLFMKRTWAMAQDWGTASEHRTMIARGLLA